MNNKKKTLAVILVVVVLLLGAASIYVATQLSTRKAVAPTAPESKPAAADCSTLTTLEACNAQTTPDCTWYATCNKCALAGSSADTVCGVTWVGSEACTLTGKATEDVTDLSVTKKAFRDDTRNSTAKYYLEEEITTVTKGQTFVYSIHYKNNGTTSISSITIADPLIEDNLSHLTFIDSDSGCKHDSAKKEVTCSVGVVESGKGSQKAFRVKVDDTVTDGMVIKNTATAVFGTTTLTAGVSLNVKVDAEEKAVIEGEKTAYKNATSNTPGKYTLTTLMETVSKSQIYVYTIKLTNTSDVKATGVTIKDSLKDVAELTFMDAVSGCTWSTAESLLTCATTLEPKAEKTFSFRVKAADSIINGSVISNTAEVTAENADPLSLTKDLSVSTVVSCNHTCTTDEECSTGLSCDTTTNKCRKTACLTEDDCVCPVIATGTPVVTRTSTPTKVAEVTVIKEVTKEVTPMELTEAGILDIPGVAAFGGGLILAIVGILLAL